MYIQGNFTYCNLCISFAAVVIALTPASKSHSFGNAVRTVDTIAKYLESTGY